MELEQSSSVRNYNYLNKDGVRFLKSVLYFRSCATQRYGYKIISVHRRVAVVSEFISLDPLQLNLILTECLTSCATFKLRPEDHHLNIYSMNYEARTSLKNVYGLSQNYRM